MSLVEWDNELNVIAKDLAAMRASRGRAHLTGNQSLIARQVAIIQAQINLDRNLERLRKLLAREFLLLPREKAMLHWGRIYLGEAQKVAQTRSRLLARNLWLKLIQTRLTGADAKSDTPVDAVDLVALAIRQTHLSQTEAYLNDSLAQLQTHRSELVTRYEQLGVVEANRCASLSMASRLGTTLEDALASPVVKALATYVRAVASPVRVAEARGHLDLDLDKTERRLTYKANGLLGICRRLVVTRLKEPAAQPSTRVLDKFQRAMQQLADLELETRQAYGQILRAVPEEPHPILVQKADKEAKTV